MPKILKYIQPGVRIVPQSEYVADSLKDYLGRHPEMDAQCTKHGKSLYFTTENPVKFKENARIFLPSSIHVEHIDLE